MIDVKDRVPTLPGRAKMTREDGSIEYVTIERADEPVESGTPINKELFDSIYNDIFSEHSHFVIGSYTGDGASNRTINLGFTPKAVFVKCQLTTYLSGGLLATKDYHQLGGSYGSTNIFSILENGFQVHTNSNAAYNSNSSNNIYIYIAIK